MEENNTMGMTYDVDVTTLAAALPEPIIVMSGKPNYAITDTADYSLMELNVYGKSKIKIASNSINMHGYESVFAKYNANWTLQAMYYGENGVIDSDGGAKLFTTYMRETFDSNGVSSGLVEFTNGVVGNVGDNFKIYGFWTYEIDGTQAPTNDNDPTLENPADINSVGDGGAVEVTACGKNLLHHTMTSQTINGVTFTVNDDGSITANGTATSIIAINILPLSIVPNLTGQDVVLSGCPAGGTYNTYMLQSYNSDWTNPKVDLGNGVVIPKWESNRTILRLIVEAGVTANNLTFKPMIRPANATNDTYEPYKGNTAIITSGLPLCSIDDVHDELIYNSDGTGKIIKKTAVKTFLSTDTINWRASQTFVGSIYCHVNDLTPSAKKLAKFLCNYSDDCIVTATPSDLYKYGSTKSDSDSLSFWFINSASVDEWKQKLSEFEAAGKPLTIIYQLATPQEIELSSTEMVELSKLKSYSNVTNVFNDESADMRIKILRRDFDMKHIDWIKESQTWICPKSGKWKIICVGGGASGGMYIEKAETPTLTPTAAGKTTSFGSIISANGAPSTSDYTFKRACVSGYGGYTGTSYGGVPCLASMASEATTISGSVNAAIMAIGNPTAAIGYGAGGGAGNGDTDVCPIAGRAGKIESTIVDIDEGRSIICTVGKGGQSNDLAIMGNGADGIIIAQYLGY